VNYTSCSDLDVYINVSPLANHLNQGYIVSIMFHNFLQDLQCSWMD